MPGPQRESPRLALASILARQLLPDLLEDGQPFKRPGMISPQSSLIGPFERLRHRPLVLGSGVQWAVAAGTRVTDRRHEVRRDNRPAGRTPDSALEHATLLLRLPGERIAVPSYSPYPALRRVLETNAASGSGQGVFLEHSSNRRALAAARNVARDLAALAVR